MDNIVKTLKQLIINTSLNIKLFENKILIDNDECCILCIWKLLSNDGYVYEDYTCFQTGLTEEQALDCAIELIGHYRYYESKLDIETVSDLFGLNCSDLFGLN